MERYKKYKDSGIEWIGEIPERWEIKKFKYLFNLITDKNDLDLPKIGLENIESMTGNYIKSDTDFDGEGIHFKINDILFGKLRPYLAKVYLARFEGKSVGDIFVFRGKNEVNEKFASSLIRSKQFIDITNSSTFGSKMPRVAWDFIANLGIAYPSLSEQTAIANYLDRKTAEIDELIAQKECLLNLYEEEKTAIINQAVTKGINPDVKLKDSGIDWLGEIPKHWNQIRLKFLTNVLKDGTHGTFNRVSDGYRLLSVRNIKENSFEFLDDDSKISEKDFLIITKPFIVMENDIQLAIVGATLGKVAIVPKLNEEFATQRSVATIRIKPNYIITKYMFYFFKSTFFQSYLWLNAGFSAQPGVYLGTLENCLIVVPNLNEQTAIVQHIETETTRINTKIEKTKKIIALQKEYRTALISEVVTGKVKVA